MITISMLIEFAQKYFVIFPLLNSEVDAIKKFVYFVANCQGFENSDVERWFAVHKIGDKDDE